MKRLFSLVLMLFVVVSATTLSPAVFAASSEDSTQLPSLPLQPEEPEHAGVVSLEGKKIMVVGNSMVYYGNCVLYGDQGKSDEGYLYQLIKANGENATVIDHTYSGQQLDDIYKKYISKLSSEELDVDYLVLSEGNQVNKNLLGTVEKYLKLFPKDVEFRFLRQPMMLENNVTSLIDGVNELREHGYCVVDWGQLVYDIYANDKPVPGATIEFKRSSFMKDNIGFKNGEGTVHIGSTGGDNNHENPLSGYITAQMLYTSIANRSAYLNDYQFCYDIEIHPYFNIDNFAKVHYTDPKNPTNFHKIFRSPRNMLGLQKLMDEYLIKEGLHPLTVQPEIKPTCISGGLTLGSYCELCHKTIDQQQFVPISEFGEHKLTTKSGKAPTCTNNGKTLHVSCTLCKKVIFEEKLIAPIGHAIKTKFSKATTSKNGKIEKICLYCDEVIENKTIQKISNAQLSTELYAYTGKAKTPSVTVTDSGKKKLVKNVDYTVTYPKYRTEIGNYTVKVTFIGNYSGTKNLTFKIRPNSVSNFKAVANYKSVTLSWDKAAKATYYRIYKYNSSTKKYSKVADTTKTSYKVSRLSYGTKYKFRIRPITRIKKTDYFSRKYKYVTTITRPSRPSITKSSSTKSRTAKLSWKEVNNAEGYQITYSTDKAFKKSKSLTVAKKGVTSATIKNLSRNKKYYFKLRAYRVLSDKKVFGSYSNLKTQKIK